MFTITIHHLDGPSGLQRHVGYVHVDGEDVQIHDPEGHLDLELPTPTPSTPVAAAHRPHPVPPAPTHRFQTPRRAGDMPRTPSSSSRGGRQLELAQVPVVVFSRR